MRLRGTATEKLADVIQMLLFVQKIGILTVQRENADNTLEEGSLFMQDGKIADAIIGNLRGADALKKLSAWTACYFVFQAQALPAHPSPPSVQRSPGQKSEQYIQPSFPTSASSVIPCRTPQFQRSIPDFERLSLSRVYRQLFLLADGQRSVDVLAKLLGRHPQEVLLMLSEMENLHLLSHL